MLNRIHHRAYFCAILLSVCSFVAAHSAEPASNNARVGTEGKGWCKFAMENLTKKGSAIKCAEIKHPRCVMMNNYWCLFQNVSDPWKGTTNAQGVDGNNDGHHAIFVDPKWAARAIARDLRSKNQSGYRSAWEIAGRYSPACDTLGTVPVRNGVGRSCSGGVRPPSEFTGPKCPRSPMTEKQCLPQCNCPPQIAAHLVKGTGLGIHEDLMLFDTRGKGTSNLPLVMRNLAAQEIGLTVSPSLIQQGINLGVADKNKF